MLDFFISSGETRDLLDYIDIFMPVLVGGVALLIAHVANEISKSAIQEQHKEFEKQLDLQKKQFEIQMKSQLDQWKYDAVIRSEIETVAEMRTLFFEAKEAIHFFMWVFLFPNGGFKHYFHNASEAPYRRDSFVSNWIKLQNINAHLNKNLIIFQKYRLASKIQFVRALLALNICLKDNDFEIEFDDKNTQNIELNSKLDPKKFYKLKNENKLKKIFAFEANQMLSTLNLADYKNVPEEEQLKKYSIIWDKVLDILNNIETDINKVLFDYDEIKIPSSEEIGIRKFYIKMN